MSNFLDEKVILGAFLIVPGRKLLVEGVELGAGGISLPDRILLLLEGLVFGGCAKVLPNFVSHWWPPFEVAVSADFAGWEGYITFLQPRQGE